MEPYNPPDVQFEHFDEKSGRFMMPTEFSKWQDITISRFVKASSRLGRSKPSKEEVETIASRYPQFLTDMKIRFESHNVGILVCWLGHSSCLVKMNTVVFLCDPVFCDVAGFWGVGPRRYVRPMATLTDLPTIDFCIISHNHYDHMDASVLKSLNNSVKWIVPKGNGTYLKSEGSIDPTNIVELDWWESFEFFDKDDELSDISRARIISCPSQHHSRRWIRDGWKALWSSFVVQVPRPNDRANPYSFIFLGDTGYCPEAFQVIGDHFSHIDVGAIPIGCYSPETFFAPMHQGPSDAVRTYRDLRVRYAFGIHHGVFPMGSGELWNAAPNDLRRALTDQEIDASKFVVLENGETVSFPV